MKTDLYTKCILTVIAVALSLLVIQNLGFFNLAVAEERNFNKRTSEYVNIPVNENGSINVNVMNDMDVNIHSIGGSSVYGSLPVNLKEVGGNSFYGSIPVNLKEMNGSTLNSSGVPVNIEAVDGLNIYNAVPVKEQK